MDDCLDYKVTVQKIMCCSLNFNTTKTKRIWYILKIVCLRWWLKLNLHLVGNFRVIDVYIFLLAAPIKFGNVCQNKVSAKFSKFSIEILHFGNYVLRVLLKTRLARQNRKLFSSNLQFSRSLKSSLLKDFYLPICYLFIYLFVYLFTYLFIHNHVCRWSTMLAITNKNQRQ